MLTVTVPQGLGDIWWVYTRLAPYKESITFRVIDPNDAPRSIVRRAESTIGALRYVEKLEYVYYRHGRDDGWLYEKRPLKPLIEAARTPQGTAWCANPWLEAGVPLEEIEPDEPVFWDLPVPRQPVPKLFPGSFLVAYASGDSVRHRTICEKVWPPEAWASVVERVCYNHGVGTSVPVVVLGSDFDWPVTALISEELRNKGFRVASMSDVPLNQIAWLMENAAGFVGYQSGLSILAEAAGVPAQAIVYFPRIARMGDAWVRPERRGTTAIQCFDFSQDPITVADRVVFPKLAK